MEKTARKSTVNGFTVGKKELNDKIKDLRKAFYEQNHCQDPIRFIADKLVELGYMSDESLSATNRYSVVNKYLVKEGGIAGLQDSYERYHPRPNPNYSYDNGGSRDLEELRIW